MKPGKLLISILDEFYRADPRPLVVVETGCIRSTDPAEDAEERDGWSTIYFAEWVIAHGSRLISIDRDADHVDTAVGMLRSRRLLTGQIVFRIGESVEELEKMKHADFFFLDTDGLEHGLAEFKQCERMGVGLVVMDDFSTKAELAAKYAAAKGYTVSREDRYTVIRLCQ